MYVEHTSARTRLGTTGSGLSQGRTQSGTRRDHGVSGHRTLHHHSQGVTSPGGGVLLSVSSGRRSVTDAALVRGWNFHILAIFGNRPTRHIDAFLM